MTDQSSAKFNLIARGLTLVSLLLIVFVYFSPVWWVSLKAPNYPAETFPDGIRIHFHMNGVENGCQLIDTDEQQETEVLDCVHEMDAINHFVGMYPIASGGVIEKAFSPFLMSLVGVLLVGFLIFNAKVRTLVMGVGFTGIAVWMYLTYYSPGGIGYQNAGYLSAMVTSLGQGHEEEGEAISPIIAKLKESLHSSGQSSQVSESELRSSLDQTGQQKLSDTIKKLHQGSGAGAGKEKTLKEILAEAEASEVTGKEAHIQVLQASFEADMARRDADKRDEWVGSGEQVLFWHYKKALGRWFNNPAEIEPLVKIMKTAGTIVFWGVIVGMAFLVFVTRKNSSPFYWLLILPTIILPVAFIVEYASWLWWYGHSLNDMGAFTLKPFMPTVLGQGKVAQFSTHSYPHYGFGMMCAAAFFMLVAFLMRRKGMQGESE